MSHPGVLPKVVTLTKQIISGRMTGSAIDRYQIDLLWDLGDALVESKMDVYAAWYSLEPVLLQTGQSTPPTLLRNAVRVRTVWSDKAAYQRVAGALGSYGKLKEAIQLFDPESRLPPAELERFLTEVEDKTYAETREIAGRLKARYIRGDPDVDPDAILDAVAAATHALRALVESGDEPTLMRLRDTVDSQGSKSLRLLLSSLQKPAVRERYKSQIDKAVLPSAEVLNAAGFSALANAVRQLEPLRKSELKTLDQVSKSIGLSFLGDFATLLKATESDEERRRYLSNQQVLRRFVATQSS